MEAERKIIIGIPVYNGLKYLQIALSRLFSSTEYPFKLIIVESGSTDGSAEFCDKFAEANKDIVEVIHTPKEGPLKAYNLLFEIANYRGCDLYLIQTDVIHFKLFQRDWLYEMHEIAKNPQIGLIAPHGAWGNTEIAQPKFPNFEWIGGWSCYIPNRIIKEFGGYDEGFEIGDKVDIDFSYRIYVAGYTLARLDYYVQHHWMTEHDHETRPDAQDIKKRTTEYFRRKHELDR